MGYKKSVVKPLIFPLFLSYFAKGVPARLNRYLRDIRQFADFGLNVHFLLSYCRINLFVVICQPFATVGYSLLNRVLADYASVFRILATSKSHLTAKTLPPGNSASMRISLLPKYILAKEIEYNLC